MRARLAHDVQRDLAFDALHTAQDLVVWPQRAPLLSLRSDWHAVDDAQQASARLERRLEHVGVADVPAVRCERPVGLNDEPPAALGIEQRGEP